MAQGHAFVEVSGTLAEGFSEEFAKDSICPVIIKPMRAEDVTDCTSCSPEIRKLTGRPNIRWCRDAKILQGYKSKNPTKSRI